MADDAFDLIELLAADHHALLGQVGHNDFLTAVVKHLTAERALLYPAAKKYLPKDVDLEPFRRTDRALETSAADAGEDSAQVLQQHIDGQQLLFDRLRTSVPAEVLIGLAEELPLVLAEAPTHAHPHLPDHGPFRELASELAASVDDIEDKFRKTEP